MAAGGSPPAPLVALRRITLGAAVGVAGAVLALAVPVALLLASVYGLGPVSILGAPWVRLLTVLVLAGSILLVLSVFLYRRGFAALRGRDNRFAIASGLCLVGTLGFLCLVASAVVVLGSTDAVASCIQGRPTRALDCLDSSAPTGAIVAVVGVALSWLGGLGLVVGLWAAGRRFGRWPLTGAAAAYALVLLVLVGPVLALVHSIPGVPALLGAVPVLLIAAPALAYAGGESARRLREGHAA
jgi:hypothetical protein